jgi:hypothetical protein
MNTNERLRCFAVFPALALPCGTPAMAQQTASINTAYLVTVYLQKDATLIVDPGLAISRDSAGDG